MYGGVRRVFWRPLGVRSYTSREPHENQKKKEKERKKTSRPSRGEEHSTEIKELKQ
jgi:hypothetical protein